VIIANSDFLNGLTYKEAAKKAIEELRKLNKDTEKRITVCDAVFSSKILGEPSQCIM
jgi:leucyl-tRNA synthetase